MKRTQIYLPEDIWGKLKLASAKIHTSVSDLIRQALTKVYRSPKSKDEIESNLDETFGLWKNRKDIKSGLLYVRKLRKGWDKRLKEYKI
jgi:Arc/MetJ-type ribon-helix-helix transcriptional regulator